MPPDPHKTNVKKKRSERQTNCFILIGILTIAVIAGAWYFYRNYYLKDNIPVLPHSLVAQLTGKSAVTNSEPYDVKGTDLGIIVKYGDSFRYIFGDTFGGEFTSMDAMEGKNVNWRSNVMAVSTDTNFADGIAINYWINDTSPGHAQELVSSLKINNQEMTVIPTGAVVLGTTFYLYYMSVNHWGQAGDWTCNNASIAVSTDGENFIKQPSVIWPGGGKCVQFAPIQDETGPLNSDTYQYFIATPSGRLGGPHLVRCPKTELLTIGSYQYLVGRNNGEPVWGTDLSKSLRLFKGALGEASVMWNPYLERYVVVYLDHNEGKILIRTAEHPWDEWGDPAAIATNKEYPGLYGGFIHPQLVEESGKTIYFIMSLWGDYNTFVMKADVSSLKS